MFIDPDLQGYSESGSHVTPITIEKDQHYTSLPTEVYYLQRTDLGKLDESFASKVSDKEYDELRKNCELIWSGETDYLVE